MDAILGFLQSTWIIFLVLGILLVAGIAGFYVDKNTDILNVEKKKRELKEKSMDVELLKSQIEDKNLSLGGAMGIVPRGGNDSSLDTPVVNEPVNTVVNEGVNNTVNANVNTNVTESGEDLNVPLNLDLH